MPALSLLWWQHIGGPLSALFLSGRLLIVGMLPPTSILLAALTCPGSTALGLGECWWVVLPSGGTQHGSALQKDKETLAQALSDCVIYCKNVPFRGFQEARSHSRPSEISSLSEAKARKLIRDEGEMKGTVAPGDWDRVERANGFLMGSTKASRHWGSLSVWEKQGPVGL